MTGQAAYLGLFFGVLAENAGLPVPGETLLLAAASYAAAGKLDVFTVAVLGATAAIAGDNLGFFVGRRFGRRVLERGPSTRRALDRTDVFLDRYGVYAVFFARFISGVRVVAALVAGSSEMPWGEFLVANALGAIVWASAVTAVGYFGLKAAEQLLLANRVVQTIVMFAGAIAIAWFVVKRRQLRRNKDANA